MQGYSFATLKNETIQLFMEDVRGELKSLRKDLDDVKLSVSFLSKEYDAVIALQETNI